MLERLRVKLYADGADLTEMLALARLPAIAGFTTNPTLMRKAGVRDYRKFAGEVLRMIPDRPVSFGVCSDEVVAMEREAREIASWGEHVYVKVPVTDTAGRSTAAVVRRLAGSGVKLNVTAILTLAQVRAVAAALAGGPSAIVSVFAGRIADTGRDPIPDMAAAVEILRPWPALELLWASPREILNVVQADQVGCHIITVTGDLLRKIGILGRDLTEYSLETVRMFQDDARDAGLTLD
jgi:transaldolase